MTALSRPVSRHRLMGLVCLGLALVVAATLGLAASARSASAAAPSRCSPANTEVWLGDGLGGGVLGGVYYPLEFTNVGRHNCTLVGYPGVSAYGSNGSQVGPAGNRFTQHHATVTLTPGATGHALLKIIDWGALCQTMVTAEGLKVFPPGQTRSEPIPFPFGACAHRTVLMVGPIRAGVGIPGYTTS